MAENLEKSKQPKRRKAPPTAQAFIIVFLPSLLHERVLICTLPTGRGAPVRNTQISPSSNGTRFFLPPWLYFWTHELRMEEPEQGRTCSGTPRGRDEGPDSARRLPTNGRPARGSLSQRWAELLPGGSGTLREQTRLCERPCSRSAPWDSTA